METIRIVLADDHGILRAGVRAILEKLEGIEVVAEAADGLKALALVEAHRPNVLVTDISMPGVDGLELAARVSRDWPETRVLVLSMHDDRAYATKAMASGATGYLLKDAARTELEVAIRAVARGESYLSSAISTHVVAEFARLVKVEAELAGPLTSRQTEVLCLIAQGLPTKAIARQLNISVKTAESHRSLLMERLDIHDVAGLTRYAIRAGLVKSDE